MRYFMVLVLIFHVIILTPFWGIAYEKEMGVPKDIQIIMKKLPNDLYTLISLLAKENTLNDPKRASAAYLKLTTMGTKAFPALIENLDDNRELSERVTLGDFIGPLTVGFASFRIIKGQVEYIYCKGRPNYLTQENIRNWWKKRNENTLRELQIEALQWEITELQNDIRWASNKQWMLEQIWHRIKELGAEKEITLDIGVPNLNISITPNTFSGNEPPIIKAVFSNLGNLPISINLKSKFQFTGVLYDSNEDYVGSFNCEPEGEEKISNDRSDYISILPREKYTLELKPRKISKIASDYSSYEVAWKNIPPGQYNISISYSSGSKEYFFDTQWEGQMGSNAIKFTIEK